MKRAHPVIVYEGSDISEDLAPYLKTLNYTDHAEGRADELELELHDRDGLWSSDWYPRKGDRLEASLSCRLDAAITTLRMGLFDVDELTISGPPKKIRIMAHSADIKKALRKKRSRAWEHTDLGTIYAQIASEHGLGILSRIAAPPAYKRVDQHEQGDLEFAHRLAKPHNLYVKLAENRLICSDQQSMEETVAGVVTPEESGRWSFRDKTHEIYKSCTVKYWDPDTKAEYAHTEYADDAPDVGDDLVINERVEGLDQAVSRARSELEKRNKWELSGSVTMPGRPELVAGVSVVLSGFGAVDGRHFIESSRHTYSRGGGYTTGLSVRKCKKS